MLDIENQETCQLLKATVTQLSRYFISMLSAKPNWLFQKYLINWLIQAKKENVIKIQYTEIHKYENEFLVKTSLRYFLSWLQLIWDVSDQTICIHVPHSVNSSSFKGKTTFLLHVSLWTGTCLCALFIYEFIMIQFVLICGVSCQWSFGHPNGEPDFFLWTVFFEEITWLLQMQ